ncbi:MAG: hypothetical protein ABJF10_22530 [Chthoniobacter sp.]|uniref:hypothetical protein n=1 Tax=Chthoniobacter sp. TaxID=2510640 RepID=UPI0032AE0BA6
MEPNEILAEIRATRDTLMRDCGGELARFGDLRRGGEARWASAGHPVVSFEGQPPVELPPMDWDKIDAAPENEILTEIRATRRAIAAEGDSLRTKDPESLALREDPPKP